MPHPSSPPVLWVAGLPVAATDIEAAARAIVDRGADAGRPETPLYVTSVNGQVLSLCARHPDVQRAFAAADVIHCDGQPLVLLSRLMGGVPLPERVATTDLFPATAALAAARGVTFYLYGATPAANAKAVAMTRAAFPELSIVGARHGYGSADDEARTVAEIARLKPDVLWVALGVPREQDFVLRHRAALRGVGVIKTSGGLFDFLAGEKARAPRVLQQSGLEWLFRLAIEPRRLFWRYLVTNPHALLVMVRSLAWQGGSTLRAG